MTQPTGTLPYSACSRWWAHREEPVWGTAATARWWVGLEQPGPWGAAGARESRLGEQVGRALEAAIKAAGGRFVLLRHPVLHRDASSDRPRRLVIARQPPSSASHDGQWRAEACELWETSFPAHLSLLEVAWDLLATAEPAELPRLVPGLRRCHAPEVWVCSHAKRDVCCAVHGRALAAALHEDFPDHVWESTHLVGHRFAPTCVVWPTGQALGRATAPLVAHALKQAAQGVFLAEALAPDVHRGYVMHPAEVQAAEAAVRWTHQVVDAAALTVTAGELSAHAATTHRDLLTSGHRVFTVRHSDGRTWTVLVTPTQSEPAPVSCGKTAVASTWMRATILEP